MKPNDKEILLQEMREICQLLGYNLRMEKGDFRGGHCLLKNERLLIINKRLSLDAKLVSLARALGELELETVYIKPGIRQFIEDEVAKGLL
jgi:hypothetical protein